MTAQTLIAQTPAQARLLLDLRYAAVLGEVMAQAASASVVAAQTGMSLKQAHHRLMRLLEVGLVHVCAEQRRGGRAVKLYRAVAESFVVPFDLTDAATLEELLTAMYRPFMAAVVRQQAGAIQHEQREEAVRLDPERRLEFEYGPRSAPEDGLAAYGTAGTFQLLHEDALLFRRELKRLQQWASERHTDSDDAQSYLLGLMFTPGQMEP